MKSNRILLFSLILFSIILIPNTRAIATGFCYQENATTSTYCGGLSTGGFNFGFYTFDINYSKPSNALSSSLWQVKLGAIPTYNISLPEECWNQSVLQFRIYSDYAEGKCGSPPCADGRGATPYCYNGTDFIEIGTYLIQSNTSYCNGYDTTGNEWKLVDGNWDTWAKGGYGWTTAYNAGGCANSSVYEEAMWWDMNLCGDNICESGENIGDCPNDCAGVVYKLLSDAGSGMGIFLDSLKNPMTTILLVLGIVGGVLAIFYAVASVMGKAVKESSG